MKVKAATFTTSGRLMRNKESTLPGLMGEFLEHKKII